MAASASSTSDETLTLLCTALIQAEALLDEAAGKCQTALGMGNACQNGLRARFQQRTASQYRPQSDTYGGGGGYKMDGFNGRNQRVPRVFARGAHEW